MSIRNEFIVIAAGFIAGVAFRKIKKNPRENDRRSNFKFKSQLFFRSEIETILTSAARPGHVFLGFFIHSLLFRFRGTPRC